MAIPSSSRDIIGKAFDASNPGKADRRLQGGPTKIMETAEGHRPFPDFLPQVWALDQGKWSAFPRRMKVSGFTGGAATKPFIRESKVIPLRPAACDLRHEQAPFPGIPRICPRRDRL
jgi:hypothetical protein